MGLIKILKKIISQNKEKVTFLSLSRSRLIGKFKEIIVQTREANTIENCQGNSLTVLDHAEFAGLLRRFPLATSRSNPTPVYNCHGLVFASRRTGISNAEEIKKIIKDDKYNEISPVDLLPGDIVLYYSQNGDIEHSGVVVSKPDINLHLPFVCSKWGKYGEMIHFATMCPYDVSVMRYFRVNE